MFWKVASERMVWFPLLGSGIKAQICSLVELLATTLNQAHVLFYTMPEGQLPEPALPCGLLFSTLEAITGHSPAGELLSRSFSECLLSRCHVLPAGDEAGNWAHPLPWRRACASGPGSWASVRFVLTPVIAVQAEDRWP